MIGGCTQEIPPSCRELTFHLQPSVVDGLFSHFRTRTDLLGFLHLKLAPPFRRTARNRLVRSRWRSRQLGLGTEQRPRGRAVLERNDSLAGRFDVRRAISIAREEYDAYPPERSRTGCRPREALPPHRPGGDCGGRCRGGEAEAEDRSGEEPKISRTCVPGRRAKKAICTIAPQRAIEAKAATPGAKAIALAELSGADAALYRKSARAVRRNAPSFPRFKRDSSPQ